MEFRILGPLEVAAGGRTLDLAEGRQSALLALLLLRPNEVLSSDGIVESLWGEESPSTAAKMLQKYVSQLRTVLGGESGSDGQRLATRGHGYLIRVDPEELDSARFERLLVEGRRARAAGRPEAAAIFREALALWRGSALQDFADEPFARADISRLEELRVTGLEDRIDADLELGHHADVVAELENLVRTHPLRERLRAQLMLALYRSNRQAEALQVYQDTRRMLSDELGLEPSAELQRLERAVLNQDPSLDWVAAPSVAPTEAPAPGERPYRGLEYFDVGDAEWFFGREDLTGRLVDRIGMVRLLTIVGASGSGKSSLVRAGLLAAMRGGEAAGDHGTIITPTAHPLEALALGLSTGQTSLRSTGALLDDLEHEPRTLHLHVQRLANARRPPDDRPFVLVVDQFEELFTLCHDEGERAAFVDNLLTAAMSDGPIRVVIALRADFYAQLAAYTGLRSAVASQQEYIGPMGHDELQRAIIGPAEHGGWRLGTGLVDLILQDLGDAPGALPLLSHALLETWHRRRGRELTVAGYLEAGGVRKAIACTADRVFGQLDADERTVGQRMLLRLTVLGEGTADTRRRVALRELIPSGPADSAETAARVLQRLADARLVSTGELTAEITHEALIQEWPTLQEWLTEDREALHVHRQITEAADGWESLDRDEGALYRGARLARVIDWSADHTDVLNEREEAFVVASKELAAREEADREEQRGRELEAAEQLAAAEQARAQVEARSARRLRRLAVLLSGALVLSAVFAAVALSLGQQAQSSFADAESQRLGAEANVSLYRGESAELAALLAIRGLQAQYTPQADGALQRASRYQYSDRIFSLPPAVDGVAAPPARVEAAEVSPDGRLLLAGAGDGNTYLLDLEHDGAVVQVLPGSGSSVHSAHFSPDGTLAATVDTSSTGAAIHLWEVATGTERWSVPIDQLGRDTKVSFSADGRRLAAELPLGVTLLDVADGHVVNQFAVAGADYVVLSPDGLTAYVAWGDRGGLWDLGSGEHLRDLDVPTSSIKDAAFSRDGTLLATTPQDKTIRIWDVATGGLLQTLVGHTEIAFMPAFSPDGSLLLSGSLDGSARLWDVATGAALRTFTGHTGSVYSAAFTPDGHYGISGGKDGTVRFWDLKAPIERDTLAAASDFIFAVAYSPDGSQLFAGDGHGKAQIWDVANQTVTHVLSPDEYIPAAAFSPDGRTLLTGGEMGNELWDANTGTQVAQLEGTGGQVSVAGYSGDGRIMIAAMLPTRDDGPAGVGLWDVATRRLIRIIEATDFNSAAISPDGSLLVIYGDGASIWDTASGDKLVSFEQPGGIEDAHFSPDGRTILAVGRDNVARLRDARSGALVRELRGHTNVIWRSAFSADGRFIFTASADKSARMWDARTGQQVRYFPGHGQSAVSGVAVSPDGREVAIASFDGVVQLTPADSSTLLTSVCDRLQRDLTDAERGIYDIADGRPTCSGG